jgi:hypothetical protein
MIHYYQLIEPRDNRRVFAVPAGEAVCEAYVREHGVELAQRWEGVWQIGGIAVVRDARYREILENTPILGEVK